ncbi:hypothetical protein [Aquimarina sp. 2201CG14-23]|uniref:hypothetical protein n=1 Tax=Aquimarina mycalae TaxID=3040073 RepID=UPI0024782282|nr:hypothetical protein [Aquimarina sp. 2201CG14-23]MDH7447230.1 hypothetical protein [Aquimarina sp. 2201CG14-23]
MRQKKHKYLDFYDGIVCFKKLNLLPMILRVYCKDCLKPNRISSNASDRVQLSKEKGDLIELKCKHCSKNQKYSPNDVIGENGVLNLILLIGMILGTITLGIFLLKYVNKGGVYSLYIIPVGIVIPSLIYFVWLLEEKKKIRLFNKFRR